MDATYSEVFDICSSTKAPVLVGIHTPVSMRPQMYLNGLFSSFRYYRYKGCTISVVPASSASVDPAFISSAPSGLTNGVHPNDLLNPILDLKADGTDLGAFIDDLLVYYGVNGGIDSVELSYPSSVPDATIASRLTHLYYQMLTSPGVNKHDINSAFQIEGMPTVYDVSTNIPMLPSAPGNYSFSDNLEIRFGIGGGANDASGYVSGRQNGMSIGPGAHVVTDGSSTTQGVSEYPQLFTNGRNALGWLPTITPIKGFGNNDSTRYDLMDIKGNSIIHRYTILPKLMMHALLIPCATTRAQYLRIIVHHHFEFAEFHSSLGAFDVMQDASMLNWDPHIVKYPDISVAGAKSMAVGVPDYDMDATDEKYQTDEMLRGEDGVHEYASVVTVNTELLHYSDGCSSSAPTSVSPAQLPVSPDSAVVPSTGQSE